MQSGPLSATLTSSWLAVQTEMDRIAAISPNGTYANTFATGAAKPAAFATTYATQLVPLPDGRAVVVPRAGTTIDVISANGATWTTGPAHGQGTSYAFSCGVLLPNGNVLMIPHQAGHFVEFDPVAMTATPRAASGMSPVNSSTPIWGAAGMGDDDLLYLAPGSGNAFAIYDWVNHAVVAIPSATVSELGAQTVWVAGGMQLVPNGDFVVPSRSSSFKVWRFNPRTGLVTLIAAGAYSFQNTPILVPSRNEVMLPPNNSANARFLNLETNAIRVGGDMASDATSMRFSGTGPMRDGRIWLAPRNNTRMVTYDPVTDAFTAAANTGGSISSTNFIHACSKVGGGALLLPSQAANVGVWTGHTGGTPLGTEVTAGRFYGAL